MAATVVIYEKNGAGGTPTDKTSGTIRFKNADNATVDLNNPMTKPSSGSDWSYEKWIAMGVSGTYTQITNVKCYSDGTNGWTGVNLYSRAITAYSTPAELTTSTGLTNFFSYTANGALSLGAGPYTGTTTHGHAVLSMEVQTTATSGTLSTETFTLAWDEI